MHDRYTEENNLTIDKLYDAIERLNSVYYIASKHIPKQTRNKEGVLEDSILGMDMWGYKVWMFHTDFIEPIKQAVKESGRKLVDFRTIYQSVLHDHLIKEAEYKTMLSRYEEDIKQQFADEIMRYKIRW